MTKSTKLAFQRRMYAAGFTAWQVQAAAVWAKAQGRGWRRVATKVYGVKP